MTATTFVTPTGRLVSGDCYKPQTTDQAGNPLTIKTGPNAGKPTQKFYFGLAIAKTQASWYHEPWAAPILAAGQAGFPRGQWQLPTFAWKITDGDSDKPNQNMTVPNTLEGYPGHWVLNFSSSFPPKIYNADGSAPIAEVDAVKIGYYVQVAGTVEGNDQETKPGVYLNHRMIALQGYGPEISRGPDPRTVGFGKGPAPAGMSATPVGALSPAAGAAAGMPGPAGIPAAGFPGPAGAGIPAPAAAAAPVVAIPHPGIMGAAPAAGFPGPAAMPAAPVAMPAAPAAGFTMTPKAGGFTRDQYIAKGWTDEALRAQGYMV